MTNEEMQRERDRQNRIFDECCKSCRYRLEFPDGTKVYSGNKRRCISLFGKGKWWKLYNNRTGELIAKRGNV